MTATIKQSVLVFLFLAILGSVFAYRAYWATPLADQIRREREDSLKRYGFYLEDVTKQLGIDFVHEPPVLDAKLDRIMPIAASMGAGVCVVDFDRDGWPDLYVVNSARGSKNRLYRNKGVDKNGKPLGFEDVAEKLGVADLNRPGDGACMGAIWGDFDNDGYEDLLVYRWGKIDLYHNDAGKGFTRVADAGLPPWMNAGAAVWLDFDGDGLLDLLICGYWADEINLWDLKTTKIMPSSFHYAKNGGSKHLLRNRGMKDGKWLGFEDVTEKMGLTKKGWVLAAAAADLRGTGYSDLVLAVDYGFTEYYANQNGKAFVEIGEKTRLGKKSKSGMNVTFGDIYNDGRRAIYISNITEPGLLDQYNDLWVPDRNGAGEHPTYQNLADTLGVARGGWSWGTQFGDLNNDGRLDLVLTNGYISGDRNRNFWYDYQFIATRSTDITDVLNWPEMKGQNLSGYQQHYVWLNRGGEFMDVAQAVGLRDILDGRAVVLVDLWNRGMLDVVQASQKGPLLVYQNTVVKDNAWIQFELEGIKSNKSAIGAQVKVFWNNQVQVQDVSGGCGYAAQNQRRLHFGLGKNARVDRVEIRWPSGHTQTIDAPQTGKLHREKEQP